MNEFIDAVFREKKDLQTLFKLAERFSTKYVGYHVHKNKDGYPSFWLYWYKSDNDNNFIPFPYSMSSEQACDFVWGWFEQFDMGEEPSFGDGSFEKGFSFKAETFGHLIKGGECDSSAVSVIIRPTWLYYGK